MRKFRIAMTIAVFFLLLAQFTTVSANTPGKHTVTLTWAASTTPGVTYNIYRGTSAGVCNGTPAPYATAISGTAYTDTNPLSGVNFYNVSAVSTSGGESACDGETSVNVPNVTTAPPSGLAGAVN